MEHTYIIQNTTRPLIIVNLDYGRDADIFNKEYENYHGRTSKFLTLTPQGIQKVEEALGYKLFDRNFTIFELSKSDLVNKIEHVNNEIDNLRDIKTIYESWLNNTNKTYFSVL